MHTPEYLFGIDLFNHGFYWEAHENWEQLWIALERSGREADFIKGLIKLAAAGVKAREGRAAGVQRHANRAGQLFRVVEDDVAANSDSPYFGGLELRALIAAADETASNAVRLVGDSADSLSIVLPVILSPKMEARAD